MALRLGLILLLLALAMVAESSHSFNDLNLDSVARFDLDSIHSGVSACNGQIGDCVDEDEEMMMESEASRRILAQGRYISYEALKANRVPCSRRGRSYYNCNQRGRANPYRRGCSYITRCARYTK